MARALTPEIERRNELICALYDVYRDVGVTLPALKISNAVHLCLGCHVRPAIVLRVLHANGKTPCVPGKQSRVLSNMGRRDIGRLAERLLSGAISLKEVAGEMKCSQTTARRWMEEYGYVPKRRA